MKLNSLAGVIAKSEQYIVNHSARTLGRSVLQNRHSPAGGVAWRDSLVDAWKFPIIDTAECDCSNASARYEMNDVTFVYFDGSAGPVDIQPYLICSAIGLHSVVPLKRVEGTKYWHFSIRVPKASVFYYRFLVNGQSVLDPINPQTMDLPTGETWSRFFTWAATDPISLEVTDLAILDRLTRHILPFKSGEGENFLKREANRVKTKHLYRLYESVGAANYIDKLIAKEERHHLYTYKTCLELIDRVLRSRNPFQDPQRMPIEMFEELYEHLSESKPGYRELLISNGWDVGRYASPSHFLQVMRRHAFSGAFAHPKYGGNAGGMAWEYLDERYGFNWRRTIEAPFGAAEDGYKG